MTVLSHLDFLSWEIRVAFRGESQLQQSRATQPTVHAGYFSVSIIHRTLTRITGSLTCSQMLMHASAHGGVRTSKESLHWKSTGRKTLAAPGKSNLRQRRAGPTLYQLSYIPLPIHLDTRSYQVETRFIRLQVKVWLNIDHIHHLC